MDKSPCALLLTGGGARAAYQVGALKAIAQLYPVNHASPFPILCGTSAGAINVTALACYASCFRLGIKKLEYIWRNFRSQQVYHSSPYHLSWQIGKILFSSFQADYASKTAFALLDNSPLRDLLHNYMEFSRIDRNILRGALQAVSITASDYSNGDSITFYQSDGRHKPWQRAKREGRQAIINPEHLLASSAIPMIFPPNQIDQDFYGDGSVHQLSPLSPPIHLGAEKILIISLEQPRKTGDMLNKAPSSTEIASHLLDTIFTDTLNADLERLNRVNDTLSLLNEQQRQTLSLKPVKNILLKPSQDFDPLADKHFAEMPLTVRLLLRAMGIKKGSNSSLTSYLMFEQTYTKELIQLGYLDTQERWDELREFLEV